MKRGTAFTLAVAFAVFAARAAQAGVELSRDRRCAVEVSGEIIRGDLARVEAALAAAPASRSANCTYRVNLRAVDGGDVDEAMKMGRWIREKRARVSYQDHCVSACVLVLAAGVRRSFTGADARVGVHRPYFSDAREMSRTQISERWRALEADIRTYLAEMRVSAAVAELMMSTLPEDMRWLSYKELKELRLLGTDPVQDEFEMAEKARRVRLTTAEFRRRYAGVEMRCFEQSMVPGRPEEESFKRWQDCEDSAVLQVPESEIERRRKHADRLCEGYAGPEWEECEQSVIVDGRVTYGAAADEESSAKTAEAWAAEDKQSTARSAEQWGLSSEVYRQRTFKAIHLCGGYWTKVRKVCSPKPIGLSERTLSINRCIDAALIDVSEEGFARLQRRLSDECGLPDSCNQAFRQCAQRFLQVQENSMLLEGW